MNNECINIWWCCNGDVEEVVYPELIMEFWANNSISTVVLPCVNNNDD